jgi:ribosomal protein L7/L12
MQGVVVLAQTGKKIEAIKLYRQLTNASLVEAKAAVDNILAGKPIPSSPASNPAQLELLAGAALPPDQQAEIRRLVQTNQKIEAIKLYRKLTGVGLKEAKDAVEGVDTNGQLKKPTNRIKERIIKVIIGLFFLGLASIFPLVFIPMGITSWQEHQIGAAIGSFIAAGIWALVWGGIGCFIIFL